MSLSNVNIIRSDGNILSNPVNQDGVSGFIFYTEESGATTTPTYTKLIELSDALDITTTDTVMYYEIEQYFSKSIYPLYVCVVDRAPATDDEFVELPALQYFSEGEIRQVAIYNGLSAFSSLQVPYLQGVAEQLESEFMPLQILYMGIYTADVTAMPDLTSLASPRVSVMIGEDRLSTGKNVTLYGSADLVSQLGLTLGLIASAPVNESIAYVSKYNVADTIVEPGFVDGTLNKAHSTAELNAIDDKKYIFFRKFVGLAGVYINFDYTACDPTLTDFSSISLNRTYDKAFRNLRGAYLPQLNSTVYVDKSGKLSAGAVKFYEGLGAKQLELMKAAGEISDYSVDIDPAQKILVTRQLDVVAKIIPTGTAKTISVKLGFSLSL